MYDRNLRLVLGHSKWLWAWPGEVETDGFNYPENEFIGEEELKSREVQQQKKEEEKKNPEQSLGGGPDPLSFDPQIVKREYVF